MAVMVIAKIELISDTKMKSQDKGINGTSDR